MITIHHSAPTETEMLLYYPTFTKVMSYRDCDNRKASLYYDIETDRIIKVLDKDVFQEIDEMVQRRVEMNEEDMWFTMEDDNIKLNNTSSKKKKKKDKENSENSLVENTVWFRDAEDVADETRDLRLKHISELELNMRKCIDTRINRAIKNTFTSVRLERSDLGLTRDCFYIHDDWDGRFNFKPNEISALKTIKAELKSLGYKVKIRTKKYNDWNYTKPYIEIDWSKPKKRKGRL